MKRICLLSVILAVFSAAAFASEIDGKWSGEVSVQGMSLPIDLNFSTLSGTVSCSLDSPKQNAFGLPAKVDYCSADSVAVSVPMIGAQYRGKIAGPVIKGVLAQGGISLPLVLIHRQQLSFNTPKTRPYQEVDTVFTAPDGTTLAGTLTFPADAARYPMVVMVTGSGPQNRNEELFGHKPFAVIADYLARHGIASFRYDDRGVAASGGDYASSTLSTFCDDAASALAFARSMPGVSSAGVLGHSEGGTIALLLAEKELPDFVVSLAGMAVSGKETILDQNRRSLKAANYTDTQIESSLKLLDDAFTAFLAADSAADVDIEAIIARASPDVPADLIQSVRANARSFNGYLLDLLSVDVRPQMGKIRCPVLALNGSLDTQVAPEPNLRAISAGIPGARIHLMPGLNHLLQHAVTGEVAEYGSISETIAPEALELIADFVSSVN